MKQRIDWFRMTVRYLGGILLFAGGAFLCNAEAYWFSAGLFLILGALESVLIYAESRRILDLRILMTVSWFLGIAAASLKLSALSSPFEGKTWVVIGGFYFAFLAAFDLIAGLLRRRKKDVSGEAPAPEEPYRARPGRLFAAILIVAGLSFAGLLLEAIRFGFRFPIFVVGVPHAYTEFHLSGVHYFVISSVFVPALTVCFLFTEQPKTWQKPVLAAVNLFALAVPVLLLSKIYLALYFVFPFLAFLLMQKRFGRVKLVLMVSGIAVISALAFALFVSRRQYPEGYLESIFQFKNANTPVAVQYPYIYVANNFENLNLLIRSGDPFSFGLRQAVPLFSLTGLKFVPAVQNLIWFPPHTTITELTTVTLIYDAYGDFGSAGVVVFGMLLGLLSYFLSARIERRKTVFTVMLYLQIAVYFGLAFFSTWFSNPTTWFWFVATAAIGLFCKQKGDRLW